MSNGTTQRCLATCRVAGKTIERAFMLRGVDHEDDSCMLTRALERARTLVAHDWQTDLEKVRVEHVAFN